MKNVLLVYRSGTAINEFKESFNKYKKHQITAIVENKITRNLMKYFYSDILFITIEEFFKGELDDMKFDYIVGNPPYQDGRQAGGQNKIYNLISKKCISLLSKNGIIDFITPISVLRNSKRFSVIGNRGLEIVDFSINKKFNVGVSICSWKIDKNKEFKKVKVIFEDGSITYVDNNVEIFPNKNDYVDMNIYSNIKSFTKSKKDGLRMFYHNNFGEAFTKEKTKYPITNSKDNSILKYSIKQPLYSNHKKFILSKSKSQTIENSITSIKDYDENHLFIPYNTTKELESIQSFIFNDWFIEFCNTVKRNLGYGFNETLIFLPKFSLDIIWTEDSIKKFLEEF